MNEICEGGGGFKIDGVCYAAPTVCDDMLLLTFSIMGLDMMMGISFRNSCLKRYDYSMLKSIALVFNETKFYYRKRRRKWYLGPNEVNEEVNYKHLDVNCNRYVDNGINVKDYVDKSKSTFMSTANCGVF